MLLRALTLLLFIPVCICIALPDPFNLHLSQTLNHLALNHTLSPQLPNLSTPNSAIACFPTSSTTTVTGCRVALNYFKDFPNYKIVQPFQVGRCPEILNGQRPPLLIFAWEANCAIEITTHNPSDDSIVDAFSFEEVRRLAMDIIEDCQDAGGHGGWSPIGRGIGWHLRVIGVDIGSLTERGNEKMPSERVESERGSDGESLVNE